MVEEGITLDKNAMPLADVIAEADDFLAMYDWLDWADLDKAQMHKVLGWKDMLDDYNNGHIGPGYCDDDDDCGNEEDDENAPGVTILPGGVSHY